MPDAMRAMRRHAARSSLGAAGMTTGCPQLFTSLFALASWHDTMGCPPMSPHAVHQFPMTIPAPALILALHSVHAACSLCMCCLHSACVLQVNAVTRGTRRVLVAEWRCCSSEDDARPPYYRNDDDPQGFAAALTHDSDSPNLHQALGTLLRERGDLRGALVEFEAALGLDTHQYYQRVLWLFIGEVKAELEDFSGTVEALQRLLNLGDKQSAREIALKVQVLKAKLQGAAPEVRAI